jgi:hypothetical protein
MIIVKAISTKLKASRHVFLRHFYSEIQKNTTDGSGVDTKSQTDRRTLSADKALFYFLKKGKDVPLQAWSGPEGSRKLRFPDFMTMAKDGGKVVSLRHRPSLPPGSTPGTHIC